MLAMTLLLQPPGEWMASRRAVLWNVLLATFQRHCCLVASAAGSASTSGGASSAALARRSEVAAREELAASSDAALLEVARPALSAFAVVSHLQAQLKPDASPERWEAAMAARLADLGRCVEIAAEMVELMDELADSSSALEAFDVLGVLKEAMEGGLSAEEFLRRLAS